MKALKVIGVILIILIAIFLMVGYFLPRSVYSERSIEMNASPEAVFNQVIDLENREVWSPFLVEDTNAVLTYSEARKVIGASYSWESKPMGSGTLTLLEMEPYTRVKSGLLFDGKREAYEAWTFELLEDGRTRVTWGLGVDELGWPMGRYYGLFMGTLMKPFFDRGLEKLREVVETAPVSTGLGRTGEIGVVEIPAQAILAIRDSVSMEAMTAFYADSYQALMQYMNEHGMQASGVPMSIAWSWSEDGKSLMEAALPLAILPEVGENEAGIYSREIPAGRVVKASHFGPYHTVGSTYEALESYIQQEGLEIAGPPMEFYITDPQMEPDTSLWETQVAWPVK